MRTPAGMDPETRGWLRLARCERLSPREAAELGRAFGGAAFADGAPGPCGVEPGAGRLDAELRAALDDRALDARLLAEARRAQDAGWSLVHLADPRYPANLACVPSSPPLLAVDGDATALAEPSVAIVGSRYPSGYGLRLADELAAGLARLGIVIVSGLAQGIDGAAHRATLTAGGRTVAVMGTGIDRFYPRQHGSLARSIARQGALVTEFPPGAAPIASNFPRRNRIIAGLADAIVVVEAKQRSGALITARHGTDFSRAILAVPGRAGEPLAVGPLGLLRDGAALACTVADVLLELPPGRQPQGLATAVNTAAAGPRPPRGDAAEAVLRLLPRDDDVPLETLLEQAAHPPDEVLTALFSLELAGLVDVLPGGAYRRARNTARQGPV